VLDWDLDLRRVRASGRLSIGVFSVWFFAIAAIANGIAHPLLSLRVGGYFPGLLTSPILGLVGILLWSRLMAATTSRRRGVFGRATKEVTL
jgi:hypothetical protein